MNMIAASQEEAIEENIWDSRNMAQLQENDVAIGEFYRLRRKFENTQPEWKEIQGTSDVTKTLWNMWSETQMKDEVLYRRYVKRDAMVETWQLIAPVTVRLKIVELSHIGMTGGHLGAIRTKEQVRRRAYWPGYSKFVDVYCSACHPCAKYRRGKPPKQGELNPINVGMPFEILSIDVTGPHPKSSCGNIYILTAMDQFSKFAFAFPMKNQEAATIARILIDQVFVYFGTPLQILSDQGTNFESRLFKEMCTTMGIDKLRTTSYKPSTNGMLERFHRTLNSMIAKVVKESQRDWDQHIPQIMAAYRSSIHSATGYSPNYLLFGQENRAPIDLVMRNPEIIINQERTINDFVQEKQMCMMKAYETARNNLKTVAQRRKNTYDCKVKQKEFFPGQKVFYFYPRRYVRRSHKFQFMYTGPYTVVKKINTVNYLIRKNDRCEAFTVHVDKLKACMEPIEVVTNVNQIHFVNRKIKMAPTRNDYVCDLCGRISSGRHMHRMHSKRCKKQRSQESFEQNPSGLTVTVSGGTQSTLDNQLHTAYNDEYDVDDVWSDIYGAEPSTSHQVHLVHDVSAEMMLPMDPVYEETRFDFLPNISVDIPSWNIDTPLQDEMNTPTLMSEEEDDKVTCIQDAPDLLLTNSTRESLEERLGKIGEGVIDFVREPEETREEGMYGSDQETVNGEDAREVDPETERLKRRLERGKTLMKKSAKQEREGKRLAERDVKERNEENLMSDTDEREGSEEKPKKSDEECREKKGDAEKMVEWIIDLIKKLPEGTSVEELCRVTEKRYRGVGRKLLHVIVYAIMEGMKNGRVTHTETILKEVRENCFVVKPVYVFLGDSGEGARKEAWAEWKEQEQGYGNEEEESAYNFEGDEENVSDWSEGEGILLDDERTRSEYDLEGDEESGSDGSNREGTLLDDKKVRYEYDVEGEGEREVEFVDDGTEVEEIDDGNEVEEVDDENDFIILD